MLWQYLISGLIGYLIGAVPTGVIIVRLKKGVTLYEEGSGHTGGTNALRTAGVTAGIWTAVIDVLLGVLAVAVVRRLFADAWLSAIAGMSAIIGHNWSVYIRFRGGIGLSTTFGSLIFLYPLLTLKVVGIVLVFYALMLFVIHFHRARTTILAMLLMVGLFWAFGGKPPVIALSAVGALVVIIKTLPDWNRQYQPKKI